MAVSGGSIRTFKSRDLWFEPQFKSPLESQCRCPAQVVRTMSFSEKVHNVSNRNRSQIDLEHLGTVGPFLLLDVFWGKEIYLVLPDLVRMPCSTRKPFLGYAPGIYTADIYFACSPEEFCE